VPRWDSRQRREVYRPQTGIDGYRLIAGRTGLLDGYDDVLFCGADGIWTDAWVATKPPRAAKVTVYRKDSSRGFSAVALWDEYVQTKKDGSPTMMWLKLSSAMLAKCAESLALRKAFPQDLSGIYTAEEMSQADRERPELPRTRPSRPLPAASSPAPHGGLVAEGTDMPAAAPTSTPAPIDTDVISPAQVTLIHVLKGELGLDDERYRAAMAYETGCRSSKELTRAEATGFIDLLQAKVARNARQAAGTGTSDPVHEAVSADLGVDTPAGAPHPFG